MVSHITPEALLPMLDAPDSLCLIDVRSGEEFAEWSIPGAINIPIDLLGDRLTEIGPGLLVLVCARGARAERGAELLSECGIDATVVEGGMAAWGRVYDEASLVLGDITIVQLRRRGKGCLSYVIGSAETCVVIDPPMEIEHSVAIARDRGWKIAYVADSHLHADHVSGARLLAETTSAELILNTDDGYEFPIDRQYSGQTINLGTSSLEIERIATPGHTMGSTTFALGDSALFTGDTLFLDSVGRPDLADRAEEFAGELFESLHAQLLVRPDSTLVFPAHIGQDVSIHCDEAVTATMGELKERLDALSMDRQSFIDWAAGRVTPRPPNYQLIVEANRSGALLTLEEISTLEAGPNRCAVSSAITS